MGASKIKLFFVGENPGTPGRSHFYTPMPAYRADPVVVRRHLLSALSHEKIIPSPTLEAFRDIGFLFDHAIRCQLRSEIIKNEYHWAKEHKSRLAHAAEHLVSFLKEAPKVWIMGYMALDAVTHVSPDNLPYIYDIPKDGRTINSKYFLSHYFRLFDHQEEIQTIVKKFELFLNG